MIMTTGVEDSLIPRLLLTDLNGVLWDLSSPSCPVRLYKVDGLEGAGWSLDQTTAVNQAGVTVVARTDKESIVACSVRVGPVPPGDEAVETLKAFLSGLGRGWSRGGRLMRLENAGTGRFQQVRLAAPYASPDWARMRWVGKIDFAFALQSDESWWRSEPLTSVFEPSGFASATVTNWGDVERGAWPHYRVDGPISGLRLGVDGESVPVPINLAAGQWLDIETDPDRWAITDHTGTDRTWSVGARWHRTVPPSSTVPVTISGSGTSSATRVTVTVPQLHHGAIL